MKSAFVKLLTVGAMVWVPALYACGDSSDPGIQGSDESSDVSGRDLLSGDDVVDASTGLDHNGYSDGQTDPDSGADGFINDNGQIDDAAAATDGTVPGQDANAPGQDANVTADYGTTDVADRDWAGYEMTYIHLKGTSIEVDGPGATATGTRVIIDSAGVYSIDGTLNDGQIRVDTADVEVVQLIFNGIDVTCSNNAPVYIVASEDVEIHLPEGTVNKLTDGATYVFDVATDTEPNAALFSKADLKIFGTGSLTVDGNYNDGIASKDSLDINGGNIVVTAKDDGIRGKDDITMTAGSVDVTAGGDGFTSDNTEDTTRGYIHIGGGTVAIAAGGDGLAAETTVTVTAGDLTIQTGGGSSRTVSSTLSAKGIKGVAGITLSGGTFNVDSADDCIHSNAAIAITGGTFTLATSDDAVHSDTTLQVDGGDLTVTKSYEGLEATTITVNDGTVHITSSDDGINVAGGDGSGGFNPGGSSSNYFLYINGGYIWMNANGDGLDSNGNIIMTGGVVLVNGPTANNNGACDFGDSQSNYFKITGGFLVAAGSSGMAVGPGTSSTQNSAVINFSSQQAGTIFHLQNSSGTDILTFKPAKTYQSVVFSSPDFAKATYDVYFGGSSTGTLKDGLYEGGAYSPGTKNTSFTVSSVTTKVGSGGGPGW